MGKTILSLGERMKRYEAVPKNYLMRRQPVIIRVDGKSFHSFTKGFIKPFDDILINVMQQTMRYLCEEIQGCVIGYTQSDEISLVLCDYQKNDTDAWFGYNVQKIVSVSASMATLKFNKVFSEETMGFRMSNILTKGHVAGTPVGEYADILRKAAQKGAVFDSRVFSIPIKEVNNYMLWRQQDATRNSIQALAQSLYSHEQIQGIDNKRLQDKIFTEKGVIWNNLSTHKKRGSCCIKKYDKWLIDEGIPIFSHNSDYVNSRIIFEQQKEDK